MRLICPNCNATYEIAEDMIPSDGRDVQCSNCGTTWFQEGRTARARPLVSEPGRQEVTNPAPRTHAAPKPAAPPPEEDDQPNEFDDAPEDEEPEAEPAPAAPARPRRPVADSQTLEILRREREHADALRRAAEERAKRAADDAAKAPAKDKPKDERPAAQPESRLAAATERARMAAAAELARARKPEQPEDRPLRRHAARPDEEAAHEEDDAISGAIAATLRAARPESRPDGDPGPTGKPIAVPSSRSARRQLLPDIEEINSTLRPDEGEAATADAETDAEHQPKPRRRGFRRGFTLALVLVALAIGLYVFAEPVAENVPALAETLLDYVAWVDAQRLALAERVEALTDSLALPE